MERRQRLIQEQLDRHNLNMSTFAKNVVGLSYVVVRETIAGVRNNRRVLKALLDLGCLPEHLALPDDMKQQKVVKD